MDLEPARDAFAAADVERLSAELAALFPNDPEIARVQEFARFTLHGGAFPADTIPATRIFLEHIARISPHPVTAEQTRSPAPAPAPAPTPGPAPAPISAAAPASATRTSRRFLSRDLDFIADLAGIVRWSIAQTLNRFVMDRIEPKKRAAVVGTMRDDGIYIMEFVAHYLALGFEHIFIYTNDNADSSLDLLDVLSEHGLITVLESEVTGKVPPEAKAFGYALNLLDELRDYEWALFVDSDEFLVPEVRYEFSIDAVLDALALEDSQGRVAGICYDWLWFISDMAFERAPGLLCERFQHAKPHWLAKCLVRVRDVISMRHQHYPEVAPGFTVVDSLFEPLDLSTIWQRRQAQYGGGRINHYWPRSFEEFAIKKARGASLEMQDNQYDRPYEQFFSWNGHSAAENSHPTDPKHMQKVKDQIDALRALEGVAAVADRIEREFSSFLARVTPHQDLRAEYAKNRAEPVDFT